MKNLCIILLGCLIASCSETQKKDVQEDKTLVQQLGELRPAAQVSFEELKGETNTEKLLYLLDLPNSVKAASLVFLDTQISSFEQTGDMKTANELRSSRELLIQAADEKMHEYIENVSKLYDDHFTQEEIDYLIEVYSAPAMRKMLESQLELQQKVVPIAENWGNEVGKRYGELVKDNAN